MGAGKMVKDLSKTEWSIMRICWEKGKSSARVIHEESLKDKKRSYQAVKTMLDRLVDKGYLGREKFGPIWLYEPTRPRSQVVSREIDTFVDTVLGNTFAPLFAYFAKKENLTLEEIESLRKLIGDHGKKEEK